MRSALTLIELIVVIAIVALLLLLLFPSLAHGRSRAVEVRCASNLRAVGQTVLSYAHSNADALSVAVRERDYFWDRGEARGWDIVSGRAAGIEGGPGTIWSCPAEDLPFMANARATGLDTRAASPAGSLYVVTLRWWKEPARLILCYDLQPGLVSNIYRHVAQGRAGDISDEMFTPWPRNDSTADISAFLDREGPHRDRFGVLFGDGHSQVGTFETQARALHWTGPRWWPSRYRTLGPSRAD